MNLMLLRSVLTRPLHPNTADGGTVLGRRLSVPAPWVQGATALTLALVFFGLYLATQTQYYTFDAVSYPLQILTYDRTGNKYWLFHPHHLLFNGLGWASWKIAASLGYRGGPLPVLQTMNATLGSLGLALFYLTLRRILTRSRALAVLLTIALGCSFGYWICATDARVNMPSLTMLIAAFLALVCAMQIPAPRRAVLAGVLAASAALLHESAGLFLVVGLTGIALADYSQGEIALERRARWRMLGWFGGAWAAAFILPYLLIGTLALHLYSFHAFKSWSARYAELGWWWSFNVLHNLRLDAYGMRRALFVEPMGKQGTFHIARNVPDISRALYFAALAGWLGAVFFFVKALPLLFRTHYRPYLIVASVWIAVYVSFFTFWSPEYFVFWVPPIIAFCVIFAVAASHYRARRHGWIWLFVIAAWFVCYGLSNYKQSVEPHLRASSNPFLTQAHDIRTHTEPNDLVIISGMGDEASAEVYLPYFAKRNVFAIHTEMSRHHENAAGTGDALRAAIAQCRAQGGRVYTLDELWNSNAVRIGLMQRHHLSPGDVGQMFTGERLAAAWRDPRGKTVWKVTPAPSPATPALPIRAGRF